MSLRDVSFQSSYNPDNCSDIIGRLYEPALAESVRYDRTTYGFSPAGLINAAAGIIYWVLLVSRQFSVPKPLSQIQRSTLWLLQGLSPKSSFGGFGLTVRALSEIEHGIRGYAPTTPQFFLVARSIGQGDGLKPDQNGFVHLSIAEFSL